VARGTIDYFDWLLLAALPLQWLVLAGWWLIRAHHTRTQVDKSANTMYNAMYICLVGRRS